MYAKWGLECCIVSQFLVETLLIIAKVEIKNPFICVTGKLLNDLINIWRHTWVLDDNSIETFEAVDNAKFCASCSAISLFDNCKLA